MSDSPAILKPPAPRRPERPASPQTLQPPQEVQYEDRSFVGQIRVSRANRSTSSWRSRQNSSRSRPGCWAVECFGPGMRGTPESPASTAWRNSRISGSAIGGGISGWPHSRAACQERISPRSARCACTGQMASGQLSAARTARWARAGRRPGIQPERAGPARSTPPSPARPPGAPRHAPSRSRSGPRAGHAGYAADSGGTSSCCKDRATPRSAAPARSLPQPSQAPAGR